MVTTHFSNHNKLEIDHLSAISHKTLTKKRWQDRWKESYSNTSRKAMANHPHIQNCYETRSQFSYCILRVKRQLRFKFNASIKSFNLFTYCICTTSCWKSVSNIINYYNVLIELSRLHISDLSKQDSKYSP